MKGSSDQHHFLIKYVLFQSSLIRGFDFKFDAIYATDFMITKENL